MRLPYYLPADDKERYLQFFGSGSELWVFAYGSLLWNPDFGVSESHLGTVRGFNRSFCLISNVYRGTCENTGLVLGLDDGGECCGLVLKVKSDEVGVALSRLWDREMVTYAYLPILLEVETSDRSVMALSFAMNREHAQYAGKLDDESILERILCASGRGGSNIEYLLNTCEHLEELGIEDTYIMRLAEAARLRLNES